MTCYCAAIYGQAPPSLPAYLCYQEKCRNWRENEAKKKEKPNEHRKTEGDQ